MKSKSLIALGAITTLLSVQTVNAIPLREVKEFVCAGGVKKTVQETSAEAKMSWIKREMKKLQEQLKGSALEYSINAPTAHLSDVNFDFGVNRSSEQTISGKYSQADVWRLGLSTNLLSSSDPGFGLGLFGTITYVRQFNTREESICNDLPFYNPTDKVPRSAADYDLSRKDALKVGELLEYETELTLGIPEFVSASFSDLKILSPFAMEGRFKVQLFRMTKNQVRVRVKTIDGVSGRLGFKYRLLGGLPSLLAKRTEIKFTLHEVSLNEMNVIDTVFNFDPRLDKIMIARGKQTSAQLYDSHIASLMQVEFKKTFQIVADAAKRGLPLFDKYRDELIKKLSVVVNASKEDAQRKDGTESFSAYGRRVYLISQAKARGVNRSSGMSGSFLNLAKIKTLNYDHESFMSITESTHKTNNFLLHGLGKFSEWKVLKLFGKTFGVSTNLILRAPEGINPKDYDAAPINSSGNGESGVDFSQFKATPKIPLTDVYGLHLSRHLKDQDFTAEDASRLKQMLKDQLTVNIFEKLTWYAAKDADDDKEGGRPEERDEEKIVDARWDEFTSKDQSNVELSQNIVFKDSIFKRYNRGTPMSVNEISARIKEVLNKKADNNEELKATPVALKREMEKTGEGNSSRDADVLRMLKSDRRYVLAFATDISEIASRLSTILNDTNARTRYEEYKQLLYNELFMEIGGIIMMYVNDKSLAQDVAVKIVLGAQNRAPIIGYFPSKVAYEQLKVFGAVIDYQNQLTDRSYNLSNFFNEAGNPISLRDLLLKSTEVNLVDTQEVTALPNN